MAAKLARGIIGEIDSTWDKHILLGLGLAIQLNQKSAYFSNSAATGLATAGLREPWTTPGDRAVSFDWVYMGKTPYSAYSAIQVIFFRNVSHSCNV
jgi:hypothetical protein